MTNWLYMPLGKVIKGSKSTYNTTRSHIIRLLMKRDWMTDISRILALTHTSNYK